MIHMYVEAQHRKLAWGRRVQQEIREELHAASQPLGAPTNG